MDQRDPVRMSQHQLQRFQIVALAQQPGGHRAAAGMAAAAPDSSISVELGNVRLERVTGRVIDLLPGVVNPALAVHRILVPLECKPSLLSGRKPLYFFGSSLMRQRRSIRCVR